jgi:hypothetical protein
LNRITDLKTASKGRTQQILLCKGNLKEIFSVELAYFAGNKYLFILKLIVL